MARLRKHPLGFLATIGLLIVALVVFSSGIAVADDTPPPTDPTTTAVDPAAPTDPATTPTDPTITPVDPAAPTDPAATPTADPAVTPTPDPTTQQGATVDNTSTSVANTGTNTLLGAGAVGSTDGTATTPAASGTTSAGLTTGDAGALGGQTSDSITQTAVASATDAAHIVITQIALIIDIGVALANTGADTVNASNTGDSAGVSVIGTGDAAALGLSGSTAVTQVVQLLAGDNTLQTASVTNVGIAVGNTGANSVSGQMSGIEPNGTAVAVSWGPANTSSVGTGNAVAAGALTNTVIIQVAMGTAADDGTLIITQRAVVVNFGAGIANTGVNAAGGSDPTALLIQGIVLALLAVLQPAAATSTVAAADASALAGGGSGTTVIGTGDAFAVGNTSSTSITQLASGAVVGTQQASAEQNAAVGNFGIALANTGANLAGSGLSVTEAAQLGALPALFQSFLSLLADPGTVTAWSADMALGAQLLTASASITMANLLFDLVNPNGSDAQVAINQITGVLHILLSFANTGANTVTTTVGAANAAGTGSSEGSAVDGAGGGANSVAGFAFLHTGNALASNRQVTAICQVINVSADVCNPPAAPVTPDAPAAPVAQAVVTPVAAAAPQQLAFTGSSSLPFEVGGGLMALVLGLLALMLRRRVAMVR